MVAAGVVVWSRQILVGGFSWSDAPVHAVDGVFALDLVREISFGHLGQWVQNYYVRYPCLGIVVFYPPFFAGVEAVFFALLGVSVFAARVSVIFFGAAGVLAMYWVARQLFDHTGGILAAGLWATLPATVLWSRQVMLEVPMTSMILICCGCYLQYRSSKKIGWLVLTAVSFVLAFLTRQWVIFFGAVLLIDFIRTMGFKKTFSSKHALAIGVSLLVIGAYTVFSAKYSKFLIQDETGWRPLFSFRHWWFYLGALPEVLSWSMLGFAAVGFLIAASTHQVKKLQIPVLWIIVFYFFATVVAYKEVRYFYPITPSGVLLAVGGLYYGLEKTQLKFPGRVILTLVLVFQFFNGWLQNPDRLSDNNSAAGLILSRADSDLVLVNTTRDGQFIFDMRRLQGPQGRVYTLRGCKVLYSRDREYVRTEKDILALIQNYGIGYIVAESGPPAIPDWESYFPRPAQLLRSLLRDTRTFEKLASNPIGDNPVWKNVRLEVYHYKGKIVRSRSTLTIPVPSMGRDIEVTLPARN